MLADPFNLWLVAKTYRRTDKTSGEIPKALRTTELVQKHIEAPDILRPADRDFLANDLVPLFAQEDKYRNALTPADIREAGELLFNAVYSEAELSDGMRRNQAFENLINADILTRQGQGASEKIAFKYERFYEYFIGNHIYAISNTSPNALLTERAAHYLRVASALPDHVFLWGALVQALIRELQGGNLSLLASLTSESERNRLLRSALVTALVRFSEDHRDKIHRFLQDLIGDLTPLPRTFLGQVWRLVRTTRGTAAPATV
ncbi:MAG: hypothetical protein NT167_01800 [Verrucomicrobia bacterium]|nr:hypothetical protein [Verrucomicrobiota bacterium]